MISFHECKLSLLVFFFFSWSVVKKKREHLTIVLELFLALRLYPAVPRNLKICVKDDVLPDGTKIYAGEWITWSSFVMGRSKTIWGEDARDYKPSRWINTEKPSQGKFNAFHVGPRVWYDKHNLCSRKRKQGLCTPLSNPTHSLVFLLFANVLNYCSLGQQFATVEAMTIIAMMLSKFTIELMNPDKHPQYGVSLSMPMLEGLPIRIHHRADKARSPTEREEK